MRQCHLDPWYHMGFCRSTYLGGPAERSLNGRSVMPAGACFGRASARDSGGLTAPQYRYQFAHPCGTIRFVPWIKEAAKPHLLGRPPPPRPSRHARMPRNPQYTTSRPVSLSPDQCQMVRAWHRCAYKPVHGSTSVVHISWHMLLSSLWRQTVCVEDMPPILLVFAEPGLCQWSP